MPHHLVGVHEIAQILGVTRQRINAIVAGDPTFPEAQARLAAGRIWSRAAVVRWAERRERRKRRMTEELLAPRLIEWCRKTHGVEMGVKTAGEVLRVFGLLGTEAVADAAEVKGRDLSTRKPHTLVLHAEDVRLVASGT